MKRKVYNDLVKPVTQDMALLVKEAKKDLPEKCQGCDSFYFDTGLVTVTHPDRHQEIELIPDCIKNKCEVK